MLLKNWLLQIKHTPTLSALVITLKLLATDKNCEKQQFLSSLGSLPQKGCYFTQFEIFSHVVGSRHSHVNLKSGIVNLKWVNPKYKTDCFIWTEHELHLCHFAYNPLSASIALI